MNKRKRNRNRSRPQASGYSDAGASLVKRAIRGFRAVSLSPLMDIDMNNMTLRQRSRMLYMAAPVATSAIDTNRTKVVGVGLAVIRTVYKGLQQVALLAQLDLVGLLNAVGAGIAPDLHLGAFILFLR